MGSLFIEFLSSSLPSRLSSWFTYHQYTGEESSAKYIWTELCPCWHAYVYIFYFLRMSVLFDLQKVPRTQGLCLACLTSHSSTCVRGVTSSCNEGVSLTLTAMWSRPRPGIQASGTSQRVTYLTHGHGTCFITRGVSWGIFVANSPGRFKSNHKHVLGFSAVTENPTKMSLFFSFCLVGFFL